MAPAVCRSRGQQCTGKGKHLSLSRGISVVHGDRAFPGHSTEGMGKPGERDPTHAVLLLGTVKWGYMIGCIYQKPWNQICDVCECLQHWEVQISLKCHRTCVPSCSTLCCSLRRKVKSTCTKWGSVGKEESATVLDCSFFSPPLWGIHPAPMTSDLTFSDAFLSPLPFTSAPAWERCSSFTHSKTALTFQCSWHRHFLCHVVLRAVNIFGHNLSYTCLEYGEVVMHFPLQFLDHSDFPCTLLEFSSISHHHILSSAILFPSFNSSPSEFPVDNSNIRFHSVWDKSLKS